jgi:rod shape-determining protein MreC
VVVDVGEWSSRVLLITDINSRIPVLLETSRYRAVLAGDNSDRPRLAYVQPDTPVAIGDRVVTSGTGGMFPAGLPIGVVASVEDRVIRVAPLAALDRVEHVRLVDFGLAGGIVTENTDADPLQ